MSNKNGFSMLEAMTPIVRLLPPARLRAWRLGWYFNSAMAFITLARVELLTTLALFSTRETVAVDTLARRATLSRLILFPYCMRFPNNLKQLCAFLVAMRNLGQIMLDIDIVSAYTVANV